MELDALRKQVMGEEFDYQTVMNVLKEYDRPRDKISQWLRKKAIVRVKKGLYVFGEGLARRPFSRELLANLIYGPSYVSLEYALHSHGLIPERVETLTSCTTGRGRTFSTPVGHFSFRKIPASAYPLGIERTLLDAGHSFLMAVPEKALADLLSADRGAAIQSPEELKIYLIESLRMDWNRVKSFRVSLLSRIALAYGSRRIRWLADLIRADSRRKRSHE